MTTGRVGRLGGLAGHGVGPPDGRAPGDRLAAPRWSSVPGAPRPRRGRRRWGARGSAGPAVATAVLGEVAGALRAGAPPQLAWQRVGVRSDDGVPGRDAVVGVTGLAAPHAAAVVAACRLATEIGAPQAALLEQVTLAVLRDAEAHDRRTAALAGPLATARLLAWLPVGGLLLGLALGADPLTLLLRPGPGTLLLVAGVALSAAGHRWTAREVRAAVRAGSDA